MENRTKKDKIIDPITENKIDSVEMFVREIIKFQKSQRCELWYRGQESNYWGLTPSIYRGSEGSFDVFLQALNSVSDKINDILSKDSYDVVNKFHKAFLCQHYGLATPILDWTTNPLVALFFAVENFKYNTDEEYPEIYILKPEYLNRNSAIVKGNGDSIKEPINIDDLSDDLFDNWVVNNPDSPMNITPFALKSDLDLSSRVASQSGVFTLQGKCTLHDFKNFNQIDCYKESDVIFKVEIDPSCAEKIKNDLYSLGFTHSNLYTKAHTSLDNIMKDFHL